MKEKLLAAVLKRINWGKLLPSIFRMIAEGDVDRVLGLKSEPIKRVYWLLAGKKTFIGAALLGLGTGLEAVCAGYSDIAWACPASRYVYMAGALLAAVGLVDAGTRSPWPAGTPIPDQAKTR